MPQLIDVDPTGENLSIGIVQSLFNEQISTSLLKHCLSELTKHGVSDEHIFLFKVPGALEIPLILEKLADTGKFDALIALGAVIRGETYHFEIVANESARGVSTVSSDYAIPIANAILTCETEEQAMARVADKGADAARVALKMAALTRLIDDINTQSEEDFGHDE